jgi:type IV secretory pathway component VirB8
VDIELKARVDTIEEKIDKIFVSVEKTRRYFFWTMIITVAVVVLPLIGLIFAVPAFISNYANLSGM